MLRPIAYMKKTEYVPSYILHLFFRFAILACITFYFWLAFLTVNSIYCFGFLAHEGPCKINKLGNNQDGTTTNGMINTPPGPPMLPPSSQYATTDSTMMSSHTIAAATSAIMLTGQTHELSSW